MILYDAPQPFISVDFLPPLGPLKVDHGPNSATEGPQQYAIRKEPARLGAVIC
jgi:hypothetical protein